MINISNSEICIFEAEVFRIQFIFLRFFQTLATAIIQLFVTSPPDHSSWIKHESGVLCFVKDNGKRSYFFRIYCPIRKRLVWQQELYNNIEYKSPTKYLHTFEAEVI